MSRKELHADDGAMTSVACLKELVDAMDAVSVLPMTVEDTASWVKRWRAREIELCGPVAGIPSVNMITPTLILAVARSTPYRLKERARHRKFSDKQFATMREAFLASPEGMSLLDIGAQLEERLGMRRDVIAGGIARKHDRWVAERRAMRGVQMVTQATA